jgi:hypothetical protein
LKISALRRNPVVDHLARAAEKYDRRHVPFELGNAVLQQQLSILQLQPEHVLDLTNALIPAGKIRQISLVTLIFSLKFAFSKDTQYVWMTFEQAVIVFRVINQLTISPHCA